MFCLCSVSCALIIFITLHLSHALMPHSCLCSSASKKIKKISENGGVPWMGAPTGGRLCGRMCPQTATRSAHQRNTPHAARCTPANIHAAPRPLFACETSVCPQICSLSYFIKPFAYNILYILIRKRTCKIYTFPYSMPCGVYPAKGFLFAPSVYTVTSTPPPRCHGAAHSGARRKDAGITPQGGVRIQRGGAE